MFQSDSAISPVSLPSFGSGFTVIVGEKHLSNTITFASTPHPHPIDHTSRPVLVDAGQSVVTNSSVLFIVWNALLHMVDSVAINLPWFGRHCCDPEEGRVPGGPHRSSKHLRIDVLENQTGQSLHVPRP